MPRGTPPRGRPPRRDATDPRGYPAQRGEEYAVDEYGRLDYGRSEYGRGDYASGDAAWGIGARGGGGGGRGRRDLSGVVPQWLPTWPTLLAALTAVVFAFILGRVTGGGGDDSNGEATPKVAVESTTTISLTPSTHIVARDETAAAIAGKYGITIDELAIANNLGDVNHVFVGQNLKIPSPTIAAATTTTTKKKSSN